MLELFRPSCSAAVRHHVRLEMTLLYMPCICAAIYPLSALAGDVPARYRAGILLYIIILPFVVGLGMWLWSSNSLPSMAHFFEDPRRSNELVQLFCFLPLISHAAPMLFVGTAQDIADTSIQVTALLMYLPVLEEPLWPSTFWICHTLLGITRIWQLGYCGGSVIQLTAFLRRTFLLEFLAWAIVRVRIWYLSRSWTPLTLSYLEAHAPPQCEGLKPLEGRTMQPELRLRRPAREGFLPPVETVPARNNGDAIRRACEIVQRRQRHKDEIMGLLLWAAHSYLQSQLNPSILANILSFLECEPSYATSFGLLPDECNSQVSTIEEARTGVSIAISATSLSSLSALRSVVPALPARLDKVFRLARDLESRDVDLECKEGHRPSSGPSSYTVFALWACIGVAVASAQARST